MRATHLILLVPELENLIREAGEASDLCARIQTRGRQTVLDSDFPQYTLLFPDTESPGPAAIAHYADLPEAEPGFWLRCDPIVMVPDLTRIWIGETRLDGLPAEAGDALAAALAAFFADEGLEYFMSAPDRGYLRLDDLPDCHFHAPWRIAGEALDHVWPEGADATRWRRLLNESQVLLHNLDALETLPPSSRPTSVWFWGEGTESPPPAGDVLAGIVGEDSLIGGLADWLEVPHHPASTRPDGGRWLVQWEADRKRSATENLEALEEQWLAPAWSALRWGGVRKLTLASMTSYWSPGRLRAWL